MRDTKVGVVGCGYWGPNIIRNLDSLGHLGAICDADESKLEKVCGKYSVKCYSDYDSMLKNNSLDAICIVTPPDTHMELGIKALNKGKHIFVEKPMTRDAEEASILYNAARKKDLVSMVGHTFVYNPAYQKLKEIVNSGDIGDIISIDVKRLNLGKFQSSGVVWDLMPHDLSMILDLLGGEMPTEITSEGYSTHPQHNTLDVARATLSFKNPNGEKPIVAFLESSWIYPNKVRDFSVIGTKATVCFDDVADPREKVRLYKDGAEKPSDGDTTTFDFAYSYGDRTSFAIDGKEALNVEMSHFVNCIRTGETPLTDGVNGFRVVRLLQSINDNIKK
jgi:predicted dehydrogenase